MERQGETWANHRVGGTVETKLNLISEIAVKDRECKFNNLMHMLSVEGLKRMLLPVKEG
jgi:hypothetical protein